MKRNILCSLLLGLAGLLAGCAGSEQDIDTPSLGGTTRIIRGTVNFRPSDVDRMTNVHPQSRTAIDYNTTTGIRYRWKPGEIIPSYFYFEQVGQKGMVEANLTVETENTATFEVPIPASFDPAQGTLRMGAVMGKQANVDNGAWADGVTSDGKANIVSAPTIDAQSNQYNLPFYAALTPVSKQGDVKLQFNVLGSWMAARVTSPKAFTPNTISITSDVVSTQGLLDLSTSGATNPQWTAGEVSDKDYFHFPVEDFSVQGNKTSQPVLVWFMPRTDRGSELPTSVSVDMNGTTEQGIRTFTRNTGKAYNFKLNKTYLFNISVPEEGISDRNVNLVISQYITTGTNPNNAIIQITNASQRDIDLRGYYLVRSVFDKPDEAAGILDLGHLEQNGARIVYKDRQKNILPAGASLVITGKEEKVAKSFFLLYKIYQIAALGDNTELVKKIMPGITQHDYCNAYFITHYGTNIRHGEPNNIVDNFGRNAEGKIYAFPNKNLVYHRRPYFAKPSETSDSGIYNYDTSAAQTNYPNVSRGSQLNFATGAWYQQDFRFLYATFGYWVGFGEAIESKELDANSY
ncbi:MAG: hypothetical protein ACOYJK_10990 [Prevotella sp.]|jgi:hypothetical protein